PRHRVLVGEAVAQLADAGGQDVAVVRLRGGHHALLLDGGEDPVDRGPVQTGRLGERGRPRPPGEVERLKHQQAALQGADGTVRGRLHHIAIVDGLCAWRTLAMATLPHRRTRQQPARNDRTAPPTKESARGGEEGALTGKTEPW